MEGDSAPLLDSAATPRWRRWSSLVCLSLLGLGCLALAAAVTLGYFLVIKKDAVGLKVMSLNTWGMPYSLGSYDKELRMAAIGQYINQSEHDVYLLQELWMRPDWETIHASLGPGLHMTPYSDLTNGGCDGVVAPDGCSGLAVVSRFPFIEVSFTVYEEHGNILHIDDGEYLARKGVGRVRVEPAPGHVTDIFLTHTCASDYNDWYRQKQVKQLVEEVKKSDADFIVLGGDFNSDPVVNSHETTLTDIKQEMVSAIEEFFKTLQSWLVAAEATYGNPQNSYSANYAPVHYDYIFHRANNNNTMWTDWFNVPIFKTEKDGEHRVSYSDHEAVTAHLYLYKHKGGE